jgi:hypothetical protein
VSKSVSVEKKIVRFLSLIYIEDNYYLSFPKDPIYMKVLVYFSIILELLQTLLVTHDTYDIFVKGFGDIADLDDLRFLWFTLPILGGIGQPFSILIQFM